MYHCFDQPNSGRAALCHCFDQRKMQTSAPMCAHAQMAHQSLKWDWRSAFFRWSIHTTIYHASRAQCAVRVRAHVPRAQYLQHIPWQQRGDAWPCFPERGNFVAEGYVEIACDEKVRIWVPLHLRQVLTVGRREKDNVFPPCVSKGKHRMSTIP